MKTFSLKTTENYPINISLFEPKISNQKLLLINSATGVKQQTYWKFAQYFAKEGFTVVTYDYYGIGLSKPKNLKKCNATMRTWGSVDYKTLTGFIQEKYPEYQKFCLGHSVGALILGMNEESDIFEKFVFVTTQKAFVGNLNLKTKVASYFGFGLVQPFLTPIFGYFPAQLFGIGESLPKGSAYDWRTLILNKKSTNRLLEKTTDFSKVEGVARFSSDGYFLKGFSFNYRGLKELENKLSEFGLEIGKNIFILSFNEAQEELQKDEWNETSIL